MRERNLSHLPAEEKKIQGAAFESHLLLSFESRQDQNDML
jgi:hypothetical protein